MLALFIIYLKYHDWLKSNLKNVTCFTTFYCNQIYKIYKYIMFQPRTLICIGFCYDSMILSTITNLIILNVNFSTNHNADHKLGSMRRNEWCLCHSWAVPVRSILPGYQYASLYMSRHSNILSPIFLGHQCIISEHNNMGQHINKLKTWNTSFVNKTDRNGSYALVE